MPHPEASAQLQPPALAVPKLGVGLAYRPELRSFMQDQAGAFDFIEVAPEAVWTDLGPGRLPRFFHDPAARGFLESLARPIVLHSGGLSIGSAHRFDREHLGQVARWHEGLRFPWHSDRLAFHLADLDGEADLGLALPLPLDQDAFELVSARVAEVRRRIAAPFLLANGVHYFELSGQDYDEASFLNALHRESGCGILLDLLNLHANACNLGWNPHRYLDRLDLDAVVEVHVSGGMPLEGFRLAAHSGAAPRAVWSLLDAILPRCRNLGGVVFELGGSWYGRLGEEGLRRQLGRVQERWARHQPQPQRIVA